MATVDHELHRGASSRGLARALAAATALLIGLSACSAPQEKGPSDSASTSASSAVSTSNSAAVEVTYPVTVRDVELKAQPTAIVSLSPTATEMLFAVGAGEQVTAVDEYSNYPESAPKTDLSGFRPNAEAIASYRPDLVVASGADEQLTQALEALSIPLIVLPAAETLEDAYTQIEDLGTATGHPEEAQKVVKDMRSRIDAAVQKVGQEFAGTTYYHELSSDFYSITDATFLGNVYGLFGLHSIAPSDGAAYPQLAGEAILSANPDLIFLTDTGASPEEVAARPGWDTVSAVQNQRISVLPKDVASRWGPRLPELIEFIADTLLASQKNS